MADTLFADVSEFQVDVDDRYPYRFIAIRSNDGTYRDHHFAHNLAWAKHACDTGRLDGFIVYFVWETNWQSTFDTFVSCVGTPHPKMAVEIDVENWGGKIRGNQSSGINACRERVITWLHGNRKRVGGYANAGDFAALWPTRGDAWLTLANYSSNPGFAGKIIHQFSDRQVTAPFGACDINSADGYTPAQLAARLGLTTAPPAPAPAKPAPTHAAVPPAKVSVTPAKTVKVKAGQTLTAVAAAAGISLATLLALNPSHRANPNLIHPGDTITVAPAKTVAVPAPKPPAPKPVAKPPVKPAPVPAKPVVSSPPAKPAPAPSPSSTSLHCASACTITITGK